MTRNFQKVKSADTTIEVIVSSKVGVALFILLPHVKSSSKRNIAICVNAKTDILEIADIGREKKAVEEAKIVNTFTSRTIYHKNLIKLLQTSAQVS